MASTEILPKGAAFTRYVIAKAAVRGRSDDAVTFAASRWGSESRAAAVTKAAVSVSDLGAAGSTSYSAAGAEWSGAIREASIVGRARFRRTALRVRTLALADAVTAAWCQPGQARQISMPSWTPAEVAPRSIAAYVVVTDEALREGGVAFEDALRDELVRAVSQAVDVAMLAPSNDGSGDAPASALNDAPEVIASGDLDADLQELIAAFEGDLLRATFVTSPEVAAEIHSPTHPNIGLRGGELLGASVITTRGAPAGTLALIDPGRILVGFGEISVDASNQSSVEITETPSGSSVTPTAAELVSLFQGNATSIRAELAAGWRVEDHAAAYLKGLAGVTV